MFWLRGFGVAKNEASNTFEKSGFGGAKCKILRMM